MERFSASALVPDLSLTTFESVLAGYRPDEQPHEPGVARAAVAAVLRFTRNGPDVLLMKRAARDNDRWSGHISMPGGRESAEDQDLVATAVRETFEEVGVDLGSTARLLGRLDTIRAVARGRIWPMTVTPYIFVQTREAPIVLGDEAVEAFWFPLDRAAAGELASEYEYEHTSPPARLPCWRYQGHVVWGLTYRMLDRLLEVVVPEVPRPVHPSVQSLL